MSMSMIVSIIVLILISCLRQVSQVLFKVSSFQAIRNLMGEVNLISPPAQPERAAGQSIGDQLVSEASLRSLTQRLPLELVEEIFLFCLPPRTYVTPSSRFAPLLLCHVCRSWKMLAISIPRLWRSIDISNPRFGDQVQVRTWLSRAGDCPLAISFHVPTRRLLHPHIAQLAQYSSRWKNIKLRMHPGASFHVLDIKSLPLLHTLRLDGHMTHIDGQEGFFSLLRSAPNLRKISWHILTTNPCSMDIPWSTLTDFHSHYDFTISEILGVLSDAPLLQRLVVSIRASIVCRDIPACRRRSLVHNHLRELELTAFEPGFAAFFDCIALPVLKILCIEEVEDLSVFWAHQEFLTFLRHFCSTLTSLHLNSPAINQEHLIEYLRCTRSLVHFHIQDGIMSHFGTDQLVSMLTYRGSEGIPYLCPKLEFISFLSKYNPELMAAMIESRLASTVIHQDLNTSVSFKQCKTSHHVSS